MPHPQFILFESASGYGLFEVVEAEEIGSLLTSVQESVTDLGKFSKIVKCKAFQPFVSAANALENANNISEGILSDDLKSLLEQNLPKRKPGKLSKFKLGVQDTKIGQAIQDELSISCNTHETISEMIRGIRLHLDRFVKGLEGRALAQAQLGLAHSYSRAKVKFNVNKADNMIIQAICLLDQLDKDLNTFAMRIREWYSWHFPEMGKIVKDNYMYARAAQYIGSRVTLTTDRLPGLTAITLDEDLAKQVYDASKSSMGMEISEIDMTNIDSFATRLISLAEYRAKLYEYLQEKMDVVAPNLGALIGEVVAARLINHAGSLTNLAKCPASTVQILGAEKALFRALKTKGNTPKYGLIFHSSFIGKAAAKNKGRISRYLANKCAMAARIDSFADFTTKKYGEMLRQQVEERLEFYETGEAPRKNLDAMRSVAADLVDELPTPKPKASGAGAGAGAAAAAATPKKEKKSKKSKKRSRDDDDDEDEDVEMKEETVPETPKSSKKEKKEKKEKKAKSAKKQRAAATPVAAVAPKTPKSSKKDKKEKKAKSEKKSKKSKA